MRYTNVPKTVEDLTNDEKFIHDSLPTDDAKGRYLATLTKRVEVVKTNPQLPALKSRLNLIDRLIARLTGHRAEVEGHVAAAEADASVKINLKKGLPLPSDPGITWSVAKSPNAEAVAAANAELLKEAQDETGAEDAEGAEAQDTSESPLENVAPEGAESAGDEQAQEQAPAKGGRRKAAAAA